MKKSAAVVAGLVLALGGAAPAFADTGTGTSAHGVAVGSPGFLSGNVVQIPVNAQVNFCANPITVIGALNPVFGATCING